MTQAAKIEARILLDSIGANESAPRLTTWILTFPRFILAEVNTHRMFSRNYPSSRAIPVKKRIQMVLEEPVIPIEWGLDKPGMQAKEVADRDTAIRATLIWEDARDAAVKHAKELIALGIHKQIANRLLEPFCMVTGLVTATQKGWENFFALRADGAADPHIQALAYMMLDLYNANDPQVLQPGDWHIPFGDQMTQRPELSWNEKVKVAVARAARVSYNSFDGADDIEKDFILHDRLAESGHWSAFEHIAQVPVQYSGDPIPNPATTRLYGNTPGWIQLRKTYPNECRVDPRVKGKIEV
jgi:thymidylate synthase ThyX